MRDLTLYFIIKRTCQPPNINMAKTTGVRYTDMPKDKSWVFLCVFLQVTCDSALRSFVNPFTICMWNGIHTCFIYKLPLRVDRVYTHPCTPHQVRCTTNELVFMLYTAAASVMKLVAAAHKMKQGRPHAAWRSFTPNAYVTHAACPMLVANPYFNRWHACRVRTPPGA